LFRSKSEHPITAVATTITHHYARSVNQCKLLGYYQQLVLKDWARVGETVHDLHIPLHLTPLSLKTETIDSPSLHRLILPRDESRVITILPVTDGWLLSNLAIFFQNDRFLFVTPVCFIGGPLSLRSL
jgi:hypothetical protein